LALLSAATGSGANPLELLQTAMAVTSPLTAAATPVALGAAASTALLATPLTPNAQILRQARRLYVGNIPAGLSELTLMDIFNQAMVKSGKLSINGMPPVATAQINHDKMFAFIEFHTPEDATHGMLFDGIMCGNNALKVRRPKDYQPIPGVPTEPERTEFVTGIVSTNVPDTEHKIFLGSLPQNLTEAQVRELVSAFGELKAFNLVKDAGALISKGYSFFEYLDVANTDRAIEGLNGLQISDRQLVCQRANTNPKTGQNTLGVVQNLLSAPGGIMAALGAALGQPVPALSTDGAGGSIQPPPPAGPPPPPPKGVPSRILRLDNMVTLSELENDEEYDDIMEDVRDECGTYGNVLSIKIPRPLPDSPADSQPGVGQIFVEFDEPAGASKSLEALDGRQFAGRFVDATFYDENLYRSGALQ